MNISEPKSVTVPELVLIAATRGPSVSGRSTACRKVQGRTTQAAGLVAILIRSRKHSSDCDARFRKKTSKRHATLRRFGFLARL